LRFSRDCLYVQAQMVLMKFCFAPVLKILELVIIIKGDQILC
jgi:hypothetical protein